MRGDVIPHLIGCFRSEALPAARAFLVKVAWERRNESVITFLDEALRIQKRTFGRKLSTVGDSCLRRIVGGFSSRPEVESSPIELRKNRFCLWLEEAIAQVEFELRR